jgi:glycosyltransferase involved in cell wall biosynthesis
VALVHDWLLGMRGGEWVLTSLLKLFPLATVHTLFYHPRGISTFINRHPIRPSPLNALPGARYYYRRLLPFLPHAVEALRLDPRAELVLSTSHCVAHGVRRPRGAVQVNYCLSPMRYLYDQQAQYYRVGRFSRWGLERIAARLRRWDRAAARRADHLWAISRFVARRIESAWGLQARVIYPPVRTQVFRPPDEPRRGGEYLMVAAMVPYKRVELAIQAARRLSIPLRIVGGGPLLRSMRRLAGPTVTLEGRVGERRLIQLYQTCRGLLFPGEEDFGIVPLEAMACGLPVLGLAAGGLLETLEPGVCGAFFDQPTVDSLAAAWRAFDPESYLPAALRAHAERFSEQRFLNEFALALAAALDPS